MDIDGQLAIWDVEIKKYMEEVQKKQEIKIGDIVEITFKGQKYIGQACRIYGPNNCIVNVIFENKHTAFLKNCIKVVG